MEAGHLRQAIHDAGIMQMVILNEKALKDGLNTKAHIKKDMAFLLSRKLEREELRFADYFVSSSEHDDVKKELYTQLRAYSEVKIVPKVITGKVQVQYVFTSLTLTHTQLHGQD